MTIYLCRICKKPTGKNPNGFYCKKCAADWIKYGARRYKIGNVWIWIRNGSIVRAMENNMPIEPIFEGREMIE